jgi:hypothetical protein
MKYKEAQAEFEKILNQKTVSVSRLKPLIESYERMIHISRDSRMRVVELSKLLENECKKNARLQESNKRLNELNQQLSKKGVITKYDLS